MDVQSPASQREKEAACMQTRWTFHLTRMSASEHDQEKWRNQ